MDSGAEPQSNDEIFDLEAIAAFKESSAVELKVLHRSIFHFFLCFFRVFFTCFVRLDEILASVFRD